MKHIKNKGISEQLVKSYMALFPLFIVLIIIIVALTSIITHSSLSQVIPTHEINLEKYMNDDIDKIDISDLVESQAKGAVVLHDGSIIELNNTKVFDRDKFSKKEWYKFLSKTSDPSNNNVYSIEYNENKDFWLVVSTPVPIRFYATITTNTESSNFIAALLFYVSIVAIIMVALFVCVLLYAKKSARVFADPLKKLCDKIGNITNEQAYVKEDNLSGEFFMLDNELSNLSKELNEEKITRKKLENDKKQILLDISHDLRNPLASIMGYAETLKDMNIDNDSYNQYINIIYNNSIRANQLMDDLFMYTKLDTSSFNPTLAEYDICEFLREQVSLYLPQFELKGIDTQFNIPDKEINIKMDKSLLARVFSNLISNSINYSQGSKNFMLSISEMSEKVMISVVDDGIGIEEEMIETIFEPFVRTDKSRNSKTGGSGLGLAIVKKIIDAHKGQIELTSSINKGCNFVIYLNK